MNNDTTASPQGAGTHRRPCEGQQCSACGATEGTMITWGVHVAAPTNAFEQPRPAWLDHWDGSVRARENGSVLEGGRFIATRSPMRVTLKRSPPSQVATGSGLPAHHLCTWHYMRSCFPQMFMTLDGIDRAATG